MKSLKKARLHFKTITKHRHLVMINCFRAGIPIQGLKHDLSKYSPVEFLAGAKYYLGDKSPNVAERIDKGYSSAWLHHKGRNKHHYEYWNDINPKSLKIEPVEMPNKYVIEMFCDRIAASKVYKGAEYTDATPLGYFSMHDHSHDMHPATSELLGTLLTMLAEKGERKTFRYIRHHVKK